MPLWPGSTLVITDRRMPGNGSPHFYSELGNF
jgi:hypothetical protein